MLNCVPHPNISFFRNAGLSNAEMKGTECSNDKIGKNLKEAVMY
jgi:hypothetical protein